ncbi:hypothetical protein BDZ89DRAFT_1116701 [Hymenopellis radicata]|nr:hypothetical protein BDZ89DRAFT_1116701 [Hymenopellis radicata]
MVPTIYLAICLLPFAVAFAEIITARRQDLARPSQYNAYGTPPAINQAQDMPESDVELLDIVLTLWSMSSFSSPKGTPVPSTLAPLVRTIHNDHDPDLIDDDTNPKTTLHSPQTRRAAASAQLPMSSSSRIHALGLASYSGPGRVKEQGEESSREEGGTARRWLRMLEESRPLAW